MINLCNSGDTISGIDGFAGIVRVIWSRNKHALVDYVSAKITYFCSGCVRLRLTEAIA
jgi:hypothetical protein